MTLPAATVMPNGSDLETTYSYDPVGNRLTDETYLGTTTYAYDDADRLESITPPGASPITYAFDANGNQTGAGNDVFAWNFADRMASATVGAMTETYTYAGDGIRLSADRGGGDETEFIVDRNATLPQIAQERDAGGELVRNYGIGLGHISHSGPVEATVYLHTDGLGSITDVTSAGGESLIWIGYHPFGNVRSAGVGGGAPVSPVAFTGQYSDSVTGLYHLRARQYDPRSGRFLSPDPAVRALAEGYEGTYAYALGNPVRLTDPSGLDTEGWCLSVTAAVGIMLGLEVCLQSDDTGDIYGTATGILGGSTTPNVSVTASHPASNAPSVQDLGGLAGTFGGSGGGVIVIGDDVTVGRYGQGQTYWMNEGRVGLGGEAPLPWEIHAGASLTAPTNLSAFGRWLTGQSTTKYVRHLSASGTK